MNSLVIAALILGAASAQVQCPSTGFKIAGSSTVFPIADDWAKGFVKKCPALSVVTTDAAWDSNKISVVSQGSSNGARRVCNKAGGQVDIGNMSRDWTPAEATSANGWTFKCTTPPSPPNSVIRVDVGLDGISVVVKKTGAANNCVAILRGFTKDQLRWVFSDRTIAQLKQSGWKEDALKNGKGTGGRIWSNLNKNCADKEINLSAPGTASGTHDYFKEKIFNAAGENFFKLGGKPILFSESDFVLRDYVEKDDAAISFFGFAYFFESSSTLTAIPIQNQFGVYVRPSKESIKSNEYFPLSRRIYMNVLTTSLAKVKSYLEFGYSAEGDEITRKTGYDEIPPADQILMLSRLQSSRGIDLDKITCRSGGKTKIGFANLAPKNENALRLRLYSIHFTAKCANVGIELSNTQTNANAFTRVCGGSPAVGSAVTFAKTTFSLISGSTFTYKCNANANQVIEVVIAPSVFGYLNNAPALLPISRPFFRFILSDEGRKLGPLLSLPVNTKAVNDAMLTRLPEGCFSGDSTVEVRNQGVVSIKNLRIGDEVKVSGGHFSKVFSFGHKNFDASVSFLSIEAGNLKPLLITPNHLILVNGKFVPASVINVGDKVTLVDGTETVTSIKRVVKSGVYAPHTMEGTIVVDAVVASSYVNLKGDSSSILSVGGVPMDWHALLHLSQAPRRVVCLLSEAVCASETYNGDGVSTWVEGQKYFARWLLDQNPVVMVSLFVPVYLFFAFASLIEAVISFAGLLLAGAIVSATVIMTHKKSKFSA